MYIFPFFSFLTGDFRLLTRRIECYIIDFTRTQNTIYCGLTLFLSIPYGLGRRWGTERHRLGRGLSAAGEEKRRQCAVSYSCRSEKTSFAFMLGKEQIG